MELNAFFFFTFLKNLPFYSRINRQYQQTKYQESRGNILKFSLEFSFVMLSKAVKIAKLNTHKIKYLC